MERSGSTSPSRARIGVALAVLAVPAVLAVWWWWPHDPDVPSASPERATTEAAAARPSVLPVAPAASREATQLAPSEPATPTAGTTASTATESFAFEFTAFERDEWSLPVALTSFPFGPTNASPVAYSEGFAQEGNELRFQWCAPCATGEIVIACGLLRRVRLEAGHSLRVAQGKHLAPPWPATAAPPSGAPAEFDPNGIVVPVFGPRLAPMAAFLALGEHATGGHFGIAPKTPRAKPARQGALRGSVLTISGQAPSESVVRVVGSKLAARTRADGSFAFAAIDVGEYEIEVGSRDGGTARTNVVVAEGVTNVALSLVAGPAVRGRVVDPSGAGIANSRLVWWTEDGDYQNRVVTGDDGTYVVPTSRAGTGSLWACVPGDGARWPVVGQVAQTDAQEVALVLAPAACRGAMHVTVPDGPVTARLWQQESGLGMPLVCVHRDEKGSDFAAVDLPAGHYTIELYSPALGVVDGGTFWCDGKTDVALPSIGLPRLCPVTITLPDTTEPSAFEFVRTSSGFPCRIHTDLGIAATHHLGPGDYELWWRFERNAPPQSLAFAIARDATTLPLRLTAR